MIETWSLEELHTYQSTGQEPGDLRRLARVAPPRGLSLTLPYPPSANHFYTIAQGRKVLSASGKRYQRAADTACLVQLVGVARPLPGRLALTLDMAPPDHRVRDLDGVLKHTQDTLQRAGVIVNDSQIDEVHLFRRAVVRAGEIVVTLRALEGP